MKRSLKNAKIEEILEKALNFGVTRSSSTFSIAPSKSKQSSAPPGQTERDRCRAWQLDLKFELENESRNAWAHRHCSVHAARSAARCVAQLSKLVVRGPIQKRTSLNGCSFLSSGEEGLSFDIERGSPEDDESVCWAEKIL